MGGEGDSPRVLRAPAAVQATCPALPEVKVLFSLKVGGTSSEESCTMVSLAVRLKAASGLAIILLVRSAVWGKNPPREILPLHS